MELKLFGEVVQLSNNEQQMFDFEASYFFEAPIEAQKLMFSRLVQLNMFGILWLLSDVEDVILDFLIFEYLDG